MNSESILKSDLLDILFDQRNKDYGAYVLRKFYPERIKTSLIIMLGIVLAFSALTFLPSHKIIDRDDGFPINDSIVVRSIELDKPVNKPVEPKQRATVNPGQRKFLSDFIIEKEVDSVDLLHDLTNVPIGASTVLVSSPGVGIEGPPLNGPPSTPDPTVPPQTDQPVDDPDVPASFPGGNKALIRFLQNNLASPRDLDEDEVIEVRIRFVVALDGRLQAFEILKDGGELFNDEVIRVLKKMPKWDPGKKGNREVIVYHTLPVKFVPRE